MIKKSFLPHAKKFACVALASISLAACQGHHKAMSTPNEFAWNELMTEHPEKAKEFYHGMFGWSSTSEEMNGMKYTMFTHHGKPVAGMMKISDAMHHMHSKEHHHDKHKHKHQHMHMPPHWMSYIAVANIDSSLEKAKMLGAEVKVHKTKVEGKGYFAVLKDPTGAHIALWQAM